MPLHIAARRHGDRHRGDHRGQHRDQRQEALGAVQRGAHLRLPRFERFHARIAQLEALDLVTRPALVRLARGVGPATSNR
ncbi:hypothetical protein ACTMU2_09320 [Cupriavidus basilensis]